jgi:hypothetical protein
MCGKKKTFWRESIGCVESTNTKLCPLLHVLLLRMEKPTVWNEHIQSQYVCQLGMIKSKVPCSKKNFIVIPERLVTRLNLFISIIPASSRTVKILSPMTHPILQNVFIIPLPDCLLVVIVHQVLIFLFSHFRLVSGLWSLDIPL